MFYFTTTFWQPCAVLGVVRLNMEHNHPVSKVGVIVVCSL